MLVRKLTYLLGGVVIGCSASAAVFAWGAQPRSASIICQPDGVKTDVRCEVIERGPIWSSSSVVLDPEMARKHERTIGRGCLERYRNYVSTIAVAWRQQEKFDEKLDCSNRTYCGKGWQSYEQNLSDWKKLASEPHQVVPILSIREGGSRNSFICHNWSVS